MSSKAIRPRVAALLAERGRVLVVRHRKAGSDYHLLPGGGVEFGEGVAEALVREVREETGLEIEVGRLLGTTETIYPDGERHILHLIFHAERWTGNLRPGPEGERVQEARWLDTKDWYDLPFLPDVRDYLLEQLQSGFELPARHVRAKWVDVRARHGRN
ncbi:MAG: NUDIX domain-containing protein [Candidatus Wallbacteria bacterium]|nr:NUDIX domain-containing protein [Candidatus Wallbacteria bacterium]